jgi:hypothetical protein
VVRIFEIITTAADNGEATREIYLSYKAVCETMRWILKAKQGMDARLIFYKYGYCSMTYKF